MSRPTTYDDIPAKDFTVQSFLSNPTGDAGTQAIARKATLDAYETKLAKLLKENKVDKLKTQYYDAGGSLFIHIEIPSETFKGLFYDVVVEFEDFDSTKTSLAANRIRFFSNSPSFAFSYAHVFQVYNIFIESLSNKYSDKIFTEIPKVRNPDFSTFYEKTITFALLYIRNKSLTAIGNIKGEIKKIPNAKLGKNIPTLDDKMALYNAIKSSEAREKKAKKRKEARKVPSIKKTKSSSDMKVNRKINNKVNNRIDNKVKNKVKV